MNYGVQLYSVRDSIKEIGMCETLRRVAAIGYRSVELAGFGDATAAETAQMLAQLGLSVDGAHIGTKELSPERIGETVANMKAIGNRRIIIPAAKLKTDADITAFLQAVAYADPILKDAGMELGFHNHHTEFLPNEDGTVPMKVLKEQTDLFFELDTYWVYHAGIDPVAEMERMGSRLKMIHLKDGIPENGLDGGKPLGQGSAPVAAVYQRAAACGIPMVVESETLLPNGMTEIAQCFAYLKQLEKAN